MKYFAMAAAISIGLAALTGCGGGEAASTTSAVSGVASKGIIRNGLIRIYPLNVDGSKGTLLKETTTDGNGAYRADLGSYHGAVLVEASGSYVDEATGGASSVPADAPLRAALDSVSGEASVAVTPLTELAVQKGENVVTHAISVHDIATNNAQVTAAFKVDILKTLPVDALSTDGGTATQAQKEHALVLAAFAELMRSKNMDLRGVVAEIKESMTADQIAKPVAAQFQVALAQFAASPANRTGINDISATSLINIGGTTRTLTLASRTDILYPNVAQMMIGGLQLTVTLPPGVTVKATADGEVTTPLSASGGAAGNALVVGHYTPASASKRGSIQIGLVSATGFTLGEFAALRCDLAPDAAPVAGDFVVTMEEAISLQGTPLAVTLTETLGQ